MPLKPRISRVCIQCGTTFFVLKSLLRSHPVLHCGRTCASKTIGARRRGVPLSAEHRAHLAQANRRPLRHGTGGYRRGCRCDLCMDAQRAYDRKMSLRHREAKRLRQRVYRATHLEQSRAAFRAWARANREHRRRRNARYQREHPDLVREWSASRRSRAKAAFVERVDWSAIYERDGGMCGICGKPVDRTAMSLDHIVPLACGGTHEPRNVQTAHLRCNVLRRHLGHAQTRLF